MALTREQLQAKRDALFSELVAASPTADEDPVAFNRLVTELAALDQHLTPPAAQSGMGAGVDENGNGVDNIDDPTDPTGQGRAPKYNPQTDDPRVVSANQTNADYALGAPPAQPAPTLLDKAITGAGSVLGSVMTGGPVHAVAGAVLGAAVRELLPSLGVTDNPAAQSFGGQSATGPASSGGGAAGRDAIAHGGTIAAGDNLDLGLVGPGGNNGKIKGPNDAPSSGNNFRGYGSLDAAIAAGAYPHDDPEWQHIATTRTALAADTSAPGASGGSAGGGTVAPAGGAAPAAGDDVETARRAAIIGASSRTGRAASILTGGQGAAAPALIRRPTPIAIAAPAAHRALLGYSHRTAPGALI